MPPLPNGLPLLHSLLGNGASSATISTILEFAPQLAYDEDKNGVLLSEAFFYIELGDIIIADASAVIAALGRARKHSSPTLSATDMLFRLIDSEEDELIVRHVAFHYREEIDFSDLILHSAASIASCADSTARGSLIVALDDIRKARASSSRSSARISQDRAAQALAAGGEGGEAAAEAVAEAGAEAGVGAEGEEAGSAGMVEKFSAEDIYATGERARVAYERLVQEQSREC